MMKLEVGRRDLGDVCKILERILGKGRILRVFEKGKRGCKRQERQGGIMLGASYVYKFFGKGEGWVWDL